MDEEITVSAIYDEIADRLAQARTRALMGERRHAAGIFQAAALEFQRFSEVLRDMPDYRELSDAFEKTLHSLRAECGGEELIGETHTEPAAQMRARRAA